MQKQKQSLVSLHVRGIMHHGVLHKKWYLSNDSLMSSMARSSSQLANDSRMVLPVSQ
jgi:hypothetical protein